MNPVTSPPSANAAGIQGPQRLARFFRWQFTIRELLLLTAAAAGFIAWAGLYFERSRPFRPTGIPDLIANYDGFRKTGLDLGYDPTSYSSSGGGSSDTYTSTRIRDYRIELPAALHGPFLDAYRTQVRTVLDAHAEEVWGAGTIRIGEQLQGFEFEYRSGKTRGRVVVRQPASNTDELVLFVFVHEFQAGR